MGCLVRSAPLHVTPVKFLVRAAFRFTGRVGVRVGVSFSLLSLFFVYRSLNLSGALSSSELFCFCAPFCGYVLAP